MKSIPTNAFTAPISPSPTEHWVGLQLKPAALDLLGQRRQKPSRSCLGNRLVKRRRSSGQRASGRRGKNQLIKRGDWDSVHEHRPTGSRSRVTGNGMCLFRSCTILEIRGSRLSCPLVLHTPETRTIRRARTSRQTEQGKETDGGAATRARAHPEGHA